MMRVHPPLDLTVLTPTTQRLRDALQEPDRLNAQPWYLHPTSPAMGAALAKVYEALVLRSAAASQVLGARQIGDPAGTKAAERRYWKQTDVAGAWLAAAEAAEAAAKLEAHP